MPTAWIFISHRSLLLRIRKTFPTSITLPTRNYVISFFPSIEVEKLSRNLNIYKSPGADYISPCILSECTQVLWSPLALFLNTSFCQGQLPCTWKSAHITPVHKKGNKNHMENYRQISLTCFVCKIAEDVVRTRVVDVWLDLNLFYPDQCVSKGQSYVGTITYML